MARNVGKVWITLEAMTFTLGSDLEQVIGAQSKMVRADLPSRWASITLVSLLCFYYLPVHFLLAVYLCYVIVEIVGLLVYQSIASQATFWNSTALLLSAFLGIGVFITLPLALYVRPEPFPKLMGAMLITIAMTHSVVTRSAWLLFGVITVLPLAGALSFMLILHLYESASTIEQMIAACLVVIATLYMLNAMREQYHLTRRLRLSAEDANEASKAKSRFMASISHELRTPLNAICAMSELIEDDAGKDSVLEERAALLNKSAQGLRAILDDVLDNAKIQAGRFELYEVPADPREEISCAVEMFRPAAEEKGLNLDLKIHETVPGYAECDPLRLRQAISNLVSNAIKYTESGGVRIRACCQDKFGRTELMVEVADTGPGISENELPNLFSEFYRIEGTSTIRTPGTGLGLSIARQLARLMGGDISVSSRLGKGSQFNLAVQIRSIEAPTKPLRDGVDKLGSNEEIGIQKLLVVDDTASNRVVVRSLLGKAKLEISEAEDGDVALRMMEDRDFDVVLLDMQMPNLNGRETLMEMVRRGGRIGETPVIMLTANAAPEDRKEMLELGASGYISKPVRKATLLEEIRRVSSGKRSCRLD
ncbi:ATP-binding protein [Phycobacter sp. K97]|uniref:ATP-binding protein n=1 Tax=Phycobacter sedimenti TaxID=3133977 RepID=UPI003120319D